MLPAASILLACLTALSSGCGGAGAPKGELRLNLGAGTVSLDPAQAWSGPSLDLCRALFVGLTEVDEGGRIVPGLAREWDVSADGRVYTFRLREDVVWSDGSRVTANDVRYGFVRTINPSIGAPYPAVLDELVVGVADYNRGHSDGPEAVGVRALDSYTLEVSLRTPAVYFPAVATLNAFCPQPRRAIERFGDRWTEPENILSDGAYRLSEWRQGQSLTLERNADYYGAGDVKNERVRFVMVADPQAALGMYERGELDCLYGTGLAGNELGRVRADEELRKELRVVGLAQTLCVGFDTLSPPFDRVDVRRAFSAAIDRERLTSEVLGSGEEPALGLCPPGACGAAWPADEKTGIGFDVKKARSYLTAAGYPDGKSFPKTTLVYAADNMSEKVAAALTAMWLQHLDVDVGMEGRGTEDYPDSLSQEGPQVFLLWEAPEYPDANSLLSEFRPQSTLNFGRYNSSRFEGLLLSAATEEDAGKRRGLYEQAERLLCRDDSAFAALLYGAELQLTKPYLERTYRSSGAQRFQEWRLKGVRDAG